MLNPNFIKNSLMSLDNKALKRVVWLLILVIWRRRLNRFKKLFKRGAK